MQEYRGNPIFAVDASNYTEDIQSEFSGLPSFGQLRLGMNLLHSVAYGLSIHAAQAQDRALQELAESVIENVHDFMEECGHLYEEYEEQEHAEEEV